MADQYDNPGPTFEKAPGNLSAARREEPFQPSGRRLPVALRTTPRPITHQAPVPSLSPRKMTVLVRDSNNRPNEAGEHGSAWYVSNPTVSGLGDDVVAPPLAPALPKMSTVVAIGAAVAMLYLAFKR